jgi:hypothetical protein
VTEPVDLTHQELPTERTVPPVVDDAPLIPDRSADDTDAGWHEGSDSNDERLLRDVPPHW